jgi:antitoxin component of MazEF toxin-antitoxin module
MDMQTNISKWGNSAAVRLPSYVLEQTGVYPGAFLTVSLEKDKIVLGYGHQKLRRIPMKELLKGFNSKNAGGEIWDDKPRGKEIW